MAKGIGRPDLLTDARFADPAKQAANMRSSLRSWTRSSPRSRWRIGTKSSRAPSHLWRGARAAGSDQGPAAQGERHRRSARRRRREAQVHDQQPPPGAWRRQGSGQTRARLLANTARKSSSSSASTQPKSTSLRASGAVPKARNAPLSVLSMRRRQLADVASAKLIRWTQEEDDG